MATKVCAGNTLYQLDIPAAERALILPHLTGRGLVLLPCLAKNPATFNAFALGAFAACLYPIRETVPVTWQSIILLRMEIRRQ